MSNVLIDFAPRENNDNMFVLEDPSPTKPPQSEEPLVQTSEQFAAKEINPDEPVNSKSKESPFAEAMH